MTADLPARERLHDIHECYGLGVLAGLKVSFPNEIKCRHLRRGGIRACYLSGYRDGDRMWSLRWFCPILGTNP